MQQFRFPAHWLLSATLLIFFAAFAAVSLGAAASGAAQNPLSQPAPHAPQDLINLSATVDSYVSEAAPTTSYGAQQHMWVGHDEFTQEQFALIQFDLSTIPAGATINSASLQVYMFDGGASAQNISVCRATSSWNVGVAWNSRPGLSCTYGSALIPTAPTNVYYSWNVTTLVNQWRNGTYSNYGLALRGPTDVYLAKGFRTVEQGNAARLVIDYSLPTATPTLTPTGTVTPDPPTVTPSPTSGPGSIGNRVWHDANHNGLQDASESGISGVRLSLVQGGVNLRNVTTNSGGAYLFSGLSAGSYSVHVDPWSLPSGYVLVSGSHPWSVTLGSGEDRLDVDFGYALPATPTPSPTPMQDLIAYDLEVTQGIQNLYHDVRFVANKRTFVRFYARTAADCCGVPSYALLRLQQGGDERWLFPLNPGGQYTVFRYMPRSMENGAFLFEMPSGWLEGTVNLTAYVNPGPPIWPWGQLPESNYANNSTSRTVIFEPVPTLNLHVYNVGYQVGSTSFLADASHGTQLVDWLRRAYPVSDVRARFEFLLFLGDADVSDDGNLTNPNCDVVNSALSPFVSWADSLAPPNAVSRLYGIVDDGGGFMRGCAEGIPGTRSSGPTGSGNWGWDFDGSYGDWYGAHEIAHNLARLHAEFCGASGGGFYPYPGGRIGPEIPFGSDPFRRLYGFDVSSREIYPDSWRDVMTYCARQWMSDYTYEGIMSYLQANARAPLGEPTDRLLVSGSIDPFSRDVRLDPMFVIPDAQEAEPRVPGDYAIVLRNGSGQLLARYPFTPGDMHSGPPSPDISGEPPEVHLLSIFEMVPYVAGTNRVDIEGPGGALLHTVTADSAAPAVSITSPHGGVLLGSSPATVGWSASEPDGDPLAFLVQFSADAGATWKTVGMHTTADSLEVPIANVVNSPDARFRVLATDGIHTSVALSAPFTVPNRQPAAEIQSPAPGHTMHINQTVGLQAWAYDHDTGTMPPNQISWHSNLDGPLGNGSQLGVTGLSAGLHTITLQADDGEGGVASDSVQITVVDDPAALPVPTSALTAGPTLISFDPWLNRTAETLYISNLAPAAIGWQASADAPWLQLSASSGDTPDALTVSLGSFDLPPGVHKATITLTSPHAAGEVQVQVELEIREDHVHLPVFAR